jgi:hypothetical protein
MQYNHFMKACIIGAGASGLAAAKALQDAHIDFDWFEKGSYIGGIWKYQNDNNLSACYKSLHINTSKQIMSYSDFPMPENYPNYPSHELIYDYFNDYARNNNLLNKVQFNSEVKEVNKLGDFKYEVTVEGKSPQVYNYLLVCNGHHWKPKHPDFKGNFSGKIIHSHDYKTFDGFEDKRVLIVGIGNSAVDIACELTKVSKKVVISTRSGAHVVPKYFFGLPTDHLTGLQPLPFLPLEVQRTFLQGMLLLTRGEQKNYGLPEPKRKILSEHPTISQELLHYAGHGKITFRPNIKELNKKEVTFEDGSVEEFDCIIYATGYHIAFPFLSKEIMNTEHNEVELYHKVVHPKHKGLYFIGLVQPLGPIMPLSEVQSKWVASLISNKISLPSEKEMERRIHEDRQKMAKRYGKSSRHTIQVDYTPYKTLIEKQYTKNPLLRLLPI